MFDKLVKTIFFVIPAKAGIQLFRHVMDPRLRGNDEYEDFLRRHHV